MEKKFSCLPLTKKLLIIGAPVIYISAFLLLYFTVGQQLRDIISSKEAFKEWINGFGVMGEAVFVGIRALQTVIKIVPAEPLEIGAGYVWGTFKGFCLCMLGTEIGSAIILLLTSLFGSRLLNAIFDTDKLKKWSFIADDKKKYLILCVVYLIPGTPKDFITYFVGVTNTSIIPFLVITGLARIPSIISSTWCGGLLDKNGLTSFIIAFSGITAISLGLGYYVEKMLMNRKIREG